MKKVIKLEPPFKPLICPKATGFFKSLLWPDSCVFEWGSGASTLWLAQQVKEGRLISIEHEPGWHREVVRALREHGLQADIRLVNEVKYPGAISEFPDEFFDIVFLDGLDRTRTACAANVVPKLKPGGWLVVDDTNWPWLRAALRRLAAWDQVEYTGEKTGRSDGKVIRGTTTFYRRPE